MTDRIVSFVMSGGVGSRLWPLSRESMPKQFVPLLGKHSTFQQTLMRVGDRSLFGRPVIATNDAYRFMAEQQAKESGIEIDILVEPSRQLGDRNVPRAGDVTELARQLFGLAHVEHHRWRRRVELAADELGGDGADELGVDVADRTSHLACRLVGWYPRGTRIHGAGVVRPDHVGHPLGRSEPL